MEALVASIIYSFRLYNDLQICWGLVFKLVKFVLMYLYISFLVQNDNAI